MPFRFTVLLALAACCLAADSSAAHYVGPEVCALCHKDIAATQKKTAMATTWQNTATSWLPADLHAQVKEGPDPAFLSEIRRFSDRFEYSVVLGGKPKVTLPVEAMVGGRRHSIGFLARIDQLDGIPLQRPTLLQARYAWTTAANSLVLAPGCPVEKPRSYQTAFGIALSPVYEERCLACHGQPNTLGAGKGGGVHCESCHGPGWQHLQAVSRNNAHSGILNPKELSAEESIGICARCHVGLTRFSDPTPDDLLIANQVVALKSSECFVQSGKAISCTTCHDPHKDASEGDETSVKACLGCHSAGVKQHAAICPVNAANSCLGCHMPAVEIGPFHLIDHQIRVHPEAGVTARNKDETLQSQVPPKQEFLRMISVKSYESAEKASQRLARGEPFSQVALNLSSAPTLTGGYLGSKSLADLDGALADAAIKLKYGETSGIIHDGDHWAILQRMPRNFKWQASQLQQEAESLLRSGSLVAAIEKAQEALMVYPHFLRALIFLARVLGEGGNPQRAVAILRIAAVIYPNDAEAAFELGRMLSKLGQDTKAIEQYRLAIVSEPDLVSAYSYLGAALYANHDLQGAADVFRQGLKIDPLSAKLYYNLSLVLAQQGDALGAGRTMTLATKINGGPLAAGQH